MNPHIEWGFIYIQNTRGTFSLIVVARAMRRIWISILLTYVYEFS